MMLCFAEQYLGVHDIAPCRIAGWIFDAGQPTTHFRVLQDGGPTPDGWYATKPRRYTM